MMAFAVVPVASAIGLFVFYYIIGSVGSLFALLDNLASAFIGVLCAFGLDMRNNGGL